MTGLEFITANPPARVDPARMDIACFVGFVTRRAVRPLTPEEDRADRRLAALQSRLPEWLFAWFRERGWLPPGGACSAKEFSRLSNLDDIPVPIENWDAFDDLFAWDARPLDKSSFCDSYLGAAVRSFYRSGGRSCIIVRLGDPLAFTAPPAERLPLIAKISEGTASSPSERESWRGVGHLFGLPEVSMLCLPDLPDLCAAEPPPLPPPAVPEGEERFIECAARANPPTIESLRSVAPPRCDENGFSLWSNLTGSVGRMLDRSAREVVFLAALPLCLDERSLAKGEDFYKRPFATRQKQLNDQLKRVREAQWNAAAMIGTAFVQLAYPWLRTRDSATLPGDLEPPDGALAGMIANLSLTRGAWQTLTREPVPWLYTVDPILARPDLDRLLSFPNPASQPIRVQERLSVFGPTSAGLRLLSDVTTDDDEHWRPGSTVRIMNLLVRAARLAGEQFLFSNNGEQLWTRLRRSVAALLTSLWAEGALEGATPADAFEVRCDRSIMTQSDIDAGRAIVRISFTVAAPITHIVVSLVMNEAGQLSIVSATTDDGHPQKEAA